MVHEALEGALTDYEYEDSDIGGHSSEVGDHRHHGLDHDSAHHATPHPPLTPHQRRKVKQKIRSTRRRNEDRAQKQGDGATRKGVHAVRRTQAKVNRLMLGYDVASTSNITQSGLIGKPVRDRTRQVFTREALQNSDGMEYLPWSGK